MMVIKKIFLLHEILQNEGQGEILYVSNLFLII